MTFMVIRQAMSTVQAAMFKSETISKGMCTWAAKLSKESIVEIVATATQPPKPIDGCT